MQNPLTLTFGKRPLEPVERPVQTKEIIDTFTAEQINQQMFIITGVRGSGKTVMMTEISQKLRENDQWIVIELNPATDLLKGLLSKLNSNKEMCIRDRDSSEREADVKTEMVKQALEVALLADHTKFERTAFVQFLDWDKVTYLVTDERPSDQWVEFCKEKGITLIY